MRTKKDPKNKTALAGIYVVAEGECPECGCSDVPVDMNVEADEMLDANWPEAVIAYYGADEVLKALLGMVKPPESPDAPDAIRQMLTTAVKHMDAIRTDIEFQTDIKGRKLTPKGERMYNETVAFSVNADILLKQYVRYRTLERFCDGPMYEE